MIETGPGGGAMVYLPIGGADRSSCARDAYDQVQGGHDLPAEADCSGADRVSLFQTELGVLAPGTSRSWGVVALFDADRNAAARRRWAGFAGERDAETLLADARDEWRAWRSPPPAGLGPEQQRTWRQSEAVLRMAQTREPWSASPKRKSHGMVLAGLPPGAWHVGWVRDAAYAIVALARTGHHQEARWALDFLDAEANSTTRWAQAAATRAASPWSAMARERISCRSSVGSGWSSAGTAGPPPRRSGSTPARPRNPTPTRRPMQTRRRAVRV
jgi:hypothetical protein